MMIYERWEESVTARQGAGQQNASYKFTVADRAASVKDRLPKKAKKA